MFTHVYFSLTREHSSHEDGVGVRYGLPNGLMKTDRPKAEYGKDHYLIRTGPPLSDWIDR